MMLYHVFQWSDLSEINYSYWMIPLSFFMFWFFYKSGMFYQRKSSSEILCGGGKKLMIPYIVFGLIGILLNNVRLAVNGDFNWTHYFLSPIKEVFLMGAPTGNLALWFLPSLLAVKLLYLFVSRAIRDEWLFMVAGSVAYILFILDIHYPMYLGNISLGLSVFSFGHLMKEKQYGRIPFVMSAIIFISLMLFHPYSIDFRSNSIAIGYYPLAVAFSLAGCVLINNIITKYSMQIKWIEWIGTRSMNFYVMHWLVLLTVSIVCPFSGWMMFVIFVGVLIIILPVGSWILSNVILR